MAAAIDGGGAVVAIDGGGTVEELRVSELASPAWCSAALERSSRRRCLHRSGKELPPPLGRSGKGMARAEKKNSANGRRGRARAYWGGEAPRIFAAE